MEIQIKQPIALLETGNQKINEDFIFPIEGKASSEASLFIVCDGEGGRHAGEVASKLVALNMAKYIASNPPKGNIDQSYLNDALATTEKALTDYKSTHPESLHMSTTMAMVHFGKKQVTLAWAGNSEVVYYNAKTQQLITTERSGDKARQEDADWLIRGAEQPTQVSMRFIPNEDINPGDYFFLATDGIKEHVDQATLGTILGSGRPDSNPEKLIEEIQNLSRGFTQDNYACYLIQIASVGDSGAIAEEDNLFAPAPEVAMAGSGSGLTGPLTLIGMLAIFVCLIGLAIYWSWDWGPDYDELMARGRALAQQGQSDEAISRFDSAKLVAETDGQKTLAQDEIDQLRSQRIRLQSFGDMEPIETLTESAQSYLDQADGYLKEDMFVEALKAFRWAERVKEHHNSEEPEIPYDRIAYASLMAGDEMYTDSAKDCNLVLAYYEKAFKILESPERKIDDPSLLLRAQERADSCGAPGALLASGAAASGDAGKTRAVPPASSGNQNAGNQTPATKSPTASNTNTSASNSSGTNTQPNARKPQQLAAGGTAPQSRGSSANSNSNPNARINTRGIDDGRRVRMKKDLSEGKRLYVKAKSEKSDYLYKLSVESLEQAAPVLDGSGAYMLAYMYHMGLGIPKDKKKALQYAQKSALQNWAAGHYLYAHILLERQNPRDTLTARNSLQIAAGQNYPEAIFRLGKIQ